jgi:1-deoxy-D-xylulose-5-phosphate synthase
LLRDHDLDVSVRNFGIPTEFLEQGKRAQIMTEIGLTAQDISRRIVETVAHRIHEEADKTESGSISN